MEKQDNRLINGGGHYGGRAVYPDLFYRLCSGKLCILHERLFQWKRAVLCLLCPQYRRNLPHPHSCDLADEQGKHRIFAAYGVGGSGGFAFFYRCMSAVFPEA